MTDFTYSCTACGRDLLHLTGVDVQTFIRISDEVDATHICDPEVIEASA